MMSFKYSNIRIEHTYLFEVEFNMPWRVILGLVTKWKNYSPHIVTMMVQLCYDGDVVYDGLVHRGVEHICIRLRPSPVSRHCAGSVLFFLQKVICSFSFSLWVDMGLDR